MSDQQREWAILLYDGRCALCTAGVQTVLRRDRLGTLRFATLEGRVGTDIRARHPELTGMDSMVWVEPAAGDQDERTFTRSDAALRVAAYLGGVWSLSRAGHLVPRAIRDAAYDLVGRRRHRLAGRSSQCPVPSPDLRARFLD